MNITKQLLPLCHFGIVFNLKSATREFHTGLPDLRWYKRLLSLKNQSYTPPKHPIVWSNDFENEEYARRDDNLLVPLFRGSPLLEQLSDRDKDLLTYKFMAKREELQLQVDEKLRELGYHPTDETVGATVIRMTMQVRYKKNLLKEHPRKKTLLASTGALVKARQYQLNLLRRTDLSEFERLSSALCITNYQHPDPFKAIAPSEVTLRKTKVREDCYQVRLSKLATLKVQLVRSEQAFLIEKQNKLQQALDALDTLEVSTKNCNSAEPTSHQLLRQLFADVVEERQSEALSASRADDLHWYAREEEARQRYQARQVEKAERASRRKRV